MKKLILCSVLLLPYGLFAQGLTLQEAVQAAIKNSNKIEQYKERYEQKNAADDEALGNFLPSLSLEATYNHLNNPLEIDLSPVRDVIMTLQAKNQVELTNIGGLLGGRPALSDAQKAAVYQQSFAALQNALPAFTEELKRQDNKYLNFSLVQPIFTGGKLLAARKAAKADEQSATIELQKVTSDEIKEVIDCYLNLLLLQDVVQTRNVVAANVRLHKNRAQKLYEQGLVPRYQYIRAEAAVAEAERNCIDDSVKLELLKLQLSSLTGLASGQVKDLKDSLMFRNIALNAAELRNGIVTENPYVKILAQKRVQAEAGYEAARSGLLPTVAAFGKYECLPEYLSALEPRWAVGVKMQFNLFNGFRDYSKMQNYIHLEKEIVSMNGDLQKNLDLMMQKNVMQVEAACARFEKLSSNLELAEENLRIAMKRAEAGTGIPLEIVDANSFYEKTKIERSAALVDYYKAYAQTLHSVNRVQEFVNIWNQD